MTKKKYDFYLENPTFDITQLCENIPAAKAKKYVQELSGWQSIPQESCLYSLSAQYFSHNGKKYSIIADSTPKNDEINHGWLRLSINLKTCKKCPTEKCLMNICSGKCRDEFVIDLIGKKLFADKYNQGK